jgi:hypothetical protein
MQCYPEQFYSPPDGLADLPYIYTYDVAASGLVNGQPCSKLSVQSDGDSEFILRAILGAQDVVQAPNQTLQVYDQMQRSFFKYPILMDHCAVWPVLPEKRYARGSAIPFDIGDVAGVGTAYAKLHFQGVKRFPAPNNNPAPSSYQWKDRPFDLLDQFNWTNGIIPVNWAAGQARMFKFANTTYDFELQQILAVDYTTAAPLVNQVAFRIFNPWPRPMMDSPIMDKYLISNCDGSPLAQQLVTANSVPQCFPSPPILYKSTDILQYEITPLTGNAVTMQLVFRGQRRIPC